MQVAYKRNRFIDARKESATQDRIRRSYERSLNRKLINMFDDISRDASKFYKVNGTQGMQVYLAKTRDKVEGVIKPHWYSVIKTFTDRMDDVFFKRETDFYQLLLQRFLLRIGANHISDIDDTTRKHLRRTLLNAQSEGLGVDATARMIRERYSPKFSRYRSAVIARTETHSAATFASHEVGKEYAKLQPALQKQWVATMDDRTRLAHRTANGQIVAMEEKFIVDGMQMEYCGDPAGGARNIINCRCVVIYLEPETDVYDVDKIPTPTPEPIPVPTPPIQDIGGAVPIIVNRNLIIGNKSKEEVERELEKRLKKNSDDIRYEELGSVNISKVSLGSMDKESANVILALQDELDTIATRFNVPKIRVILPQRGDAFAAMGISRANAGNLYINSKYINRLGRFTGKPKSLEGVREALQKELDDLIKANDDVAKQLNKFQEELRQETAKWKGWRPRELLAQERLGASGIANIEKQLGRKWTPALKQELEESHQKYMRLYFSKEKERVKKLYDRNIKNIDKVKWSLDPTRTTWYKQSKWKIGDDAKGMPHNGFDYFDNATDRIRNTLFHEMGHQVHGMKSRIVERGVLFNGRRVPLERVLKSQREYIRANRSRAMSKYSTVDDHEWFAENFALYNQGELKMMDQHARKLIEAVEKDLDLKTVFPDIDEYVLRNL